MCQCKDGYFGRACEHRCYNGTVVNVDYIGEKYGECQCAGNCTNGFNCEMTCNNNGVCADDGSHCVCDYYKGYKGTYCTVDGCPGWPENCMGHATEPGGCNTATRKCTCKPGYIGKAIILHLTLYLTDSVTIFNSCFN